MVTRKDQIIQTIESAFQDDACQEKIERLKTFERGFMVCTLEGRFAIWVFVTEPEPMFVF